jgi:hypothetical protein
MPIDERVGKRGEVTTLGLGLACAGTRNGWIFCDFFRAFCAIFQKKKPISLALSRFFFRKNQNFLKFSEKSKNFQKKNLKN